MVYLGTFMLYCLVSFDAFCFEGESKMFTINCVACYFWCCRFFFLKSFLDFCTLTFLLNGFPLGIHLWLFRSVLGWYICSCIHLSSFAVLIGGKCICGIITKDKGYMFTQSNREQINLFKQFFKERIDWLLSNHAKSTR
jgi:hypothetical protein